MNAKDLTNFASYIIMVDNHNEQYDLSIFEFLKYQEFENVSPKNTLELSWFASAFMQYQESIPNMVDSFIHTFSIINWFHKNAWDVNAYIDSCIEYLNKQTYTKKYDDTYIITRIAHEIVVINVVDHEWYGEMHEDLPIELNSLFGEK